MKRSDLEILSADELWDMYHKITAMLQAKISAQRKVLEDQLAQLNGRFRVE
jgi:DNA-binding protein H-NS